MKSNLKSASIVRFATALSLLALAACDSMQYEPPKVFGGSEVPDQVLAQPRLVPTPASTEMANLTWSRLGDVPAKPTNFTPQPLINQSIQQMQDDRMEAQAIKASVENPIPVMSPPPTAQP